MLWTHPCSTGSAPKAQPSQPDKPVACAICGHGPEKPWAALLEGDVYYVDLELVLMLSCNSDTRHDVRQAAADDVHVVPDGLR